VHPSPDPDLALRYLTGETPGAALFRHAAALRDEGKGRVVTYSRKVFIPLTTLCVDRCSYCTFAKPPGAGGVYMEPDEVLAVARAGDAAGCTEALFTLGDRPEERWPRAREFLEQKGHATTLEYVAEMSALVRSETGVFPHANPGLLDDDGFRLLRPTNPSMGMMLENISPRLTEPGMPHHGTVTKVPAKRVATIEAAGRHKVPFTTGILVGIGENNRAGAPLVRPGGGARSLDHGARGQRAGAPKPHPGLRDLPRRRDQRLGWCLAADHRLGQSRGTMAPPRRALSENFGRRVRASAETAGLPRIHQ
jgi:biotin synthase-like enzyme